MWYGKKSHSLKGFNIVMMWGPDSNVIIQCQKCFGGSPKSFGPPKYWKPNTKIKDKSKTLGAELRLLPNFALNNK